jgi:hypothetical protein
MKRRKTITVVKRVPRKSVVGVVNPLAANPKSPSGAATSVRFLVVDNLGSGGGSGGYERRSQDSQKVDVLPSRREEHGKNSENKNNNNNNDDEEDEEMIEVEIDEEVSDSGSDDGDDEVEYRPLQHHPSVVIRHKVGGGDTSDALSSLVLPSTIRESSVMNSTNNETSLLAASSPGSPLTKRRRRQEKKKLVEKQEFGFNKAIVSYLLDEHKKAMKTILSAEAQQQRQHQQNLSKSTRISQLGAQVFGSITEMPSFFGASVLGPGSGEYSGSINPTNNNNNNNNKNNNLFVGASTSGLPPRLLGKRAKELFELHQKLSQPILSKNDEDELKKSVAKLHEQHLKQVAERQEATDYRIDRDNILAVVVFFVVVSISSFIAMVITLAGITETTKRDKQLFLPVSGVTLREIKQQYSFLGENAQFQTIEDELAGYRNWTHFVENCCCSAFVNQKGADGGVAAAISVEKWLCANGKVKERIRQKTPTFDRSVTTIRSICGREFFNLCRVNVEATAPFYSYLTGCNSSVSEEDKKCW